MGFYGTMMKKLPVILFTLTLTALVNSCSANEKYIEPRFFDVNQGREADASQVLPRLQESRLVLVGEHHTDMDHHAAQLQVVQMLHKAGADVTIGMEMFSSDSQQALNRWVSGEIGDAEFQKIYYNNWNFPWSLYSSIFEYARDKKIPIVGLNVPRKITRQVARQGFQSLSETQKEKLSHITCRVDKEYMEYIRKAYGGHAHGNLNFIYFCEAQLVWDSAMADNALRYLNSNPDTVMVILAGTGHVRKQAIPAKIRSRSDMPYTVILPEVPGHIEKSTVNRKDADYIFME